MDQFLLLRFAHLIGLMLMSAGLLGVFIADIADFNAALCGTASVAEVLKP